MKKAAFLYFSTIVIIFLVCCGYFLYIPQKDDAQDTSDLFVIESKNIQPEIILQEQDPNLSYDSLDSSIVDFTNLRKMTGINTLTIREQEIQPISIAVLDTGVFPHKELTGSKSRILHSKDFINDRVIPYDDNGHGTAMAGVIANVASTEDGIPLCNFVSVKVMDYTCKGNRSCIVKGIEWVIANKNKYNIKIINLSVGLPVITGEDILIESVRNANEAGILVVTSGGNQKPGTFMYSPAIDSNCISVGAIGNTYITDKKEYQIAPFSIEWEYEGNVGPDIYAPGHNIKTLKSNIYYTGETEIVNDQLYTYVSGTSIATAVVSGVAACYFQLYPDISIDELKEVIMEHSMMVSDHEKAKEFKFIYLGGV